KLRGPAPHRSVVRLLRRHVQPSRTGQRLSTSAPVRCRPSALSARLTLPAFFFAEALVALMVFRRPLTSEFVADDLWLLGAPVDVGAMLQGLVLEPLRRPLTPMFYGVLYWVC